ncbi:MAG TPA: diacylglycerol kinase family protein [Firmicutes bacterium]|nr:diacylglycerol kinase family protein [Candidatus Fermentithermobacillaceae bacterium]
MERTGKNTEGVELLKRPPNHSRSLWESFSHAWEGLAYTYRTERNMRIHVFVASLVVAAGIALGLERTEFLMVIVAIAAVLSAEVVNTLAEYFVDLMKPEYDEIAGIAKDVAAAGVLLTSVFSVFVGVVAFYPALFDMEARFRALLEKRWPFLLLHFFLAVAPSFAGLLICAQKSPSRSEDFRTSREEDRNCSIRRKG